VQTIPLGSQASFDIDISGLGNGTALGTYDINLDFDPSLLSYSSITFGNQLDLFGLGDIQSVTPGIGSVEVFELSIDSAADLNALQSDAFLLATLNFSTLATGLDSPVTLSVNALGDAFGNSISPATQNGTVSVTSSPEPGPIWLLIMALPVFPLLRKSLQK
jgi:hypothetical protein